MLSRHRLPRRSTTRAGALTAALAAAVLGLGALAPAEAAPARALPDRLALPDGWQPEGVTTNGHVLFTGSLRDGALYRTNPRTGAGRVLAPGATGRVAVGLDYDRRRKLLWVAGGATGEVRAQDVRTGAVLATYSFGSASPRFLNDVVVTRDAVVVTDSNNAELAVVPLGPGRALPAAGRATTVPLRGDIVYGEGFNLNGIVRSHGKVLAVQSNTGLLFRISPSGRTRTVPLGGATLVNGDGMEVRGDTLYVVRNQDQLVEVVRLRHRATAGRVVTELTDSDFDVPTTLAEVDGSLYAVNARFNTTPTPGTEYWITRLDAYRR